MMVAGTIKLPVLKVSQPIGDFYIASIKAQDLVKICYNDVRRLATELRDVERYLGIQRPISKKRIKEIKKYVTAQDATFPTAVIVTIDERCVEYNEESRVLTLSSFGGDPETGEEQIPYEMIAKVIDGQHRIASFMDENGNWAFPFEDRDFDINLSIFVGADISEQANIFATVNLAQTKVSKSLVYDLTELARTSSPHKSCHNVAVALDKEESSPLHKRIKRLGTATPGRTKEPLTQASFVEALVKFITPDAVRDRNDLLDSKKLKRATIDELKKHPFRNLFIENKDLDIAEILFNYFVAVRDKWPKSWDAKDQVGNLLPKSNAFKALMKFLKDDVYLDIVGEEIGRIPLSKEFYRYLEPIDVTDNDFTSKNFVPGSGGQSMFLKMLRLQISRNDIIE
ncbi:MAG: DGQHR domain-containing protein [bacterium]